MKKICSTLLLLFIVLTRINAAEVTFTFNTEEGLAAIGLSSNEEFEDGKAYNWDGLTFTFTTGTAKARILNGTLRIYKNGGTMTVSAPGNITAITINGSGTMTASNGNYTSANGTSTWSGAASTIVFTVKTNQQVKTMTVTYEGDTTPSTSVTSLAEIQHLDDGTRVNLYLSDGQMARVVNTDDDVCLKDISGTVYFRGFTTNPEMTVNRHVAGYITAIKSSAGNKTLLEPATDTSSYRLIIADPVTEGDVTAIRPVTSHKTDNDTHTYNISGQRVSDNTPGILIKNNKKILKK